MIELKPCPNPGCGNAYPKLVAIGYEDRDDLPEKLQDLEDAPYAVVCYGCGVMGSMAEREQDAADAWNLLPRTDFRALAQELAGAGQLAYAVLGEMGCTKYSPIRDAWDALDTALDHAKAVGLEVP